MKHIINHGPCFDARVPISMYYFLHPRPCTTIQMENVKERIMCCEFRSYVNRWYDVFIDICT